MNKFNWNLLLKIQESRFILIYDRNIRIEIFAIKYQISYFCEIKFQFQEQQVFALKKELKKLRKKKLQIPTIYNIPI